MTFPSLEKNEGKKEEGESDGLSTFSEVPLSHDQEKKQVNVGGNNVGALVAKSKKAASSLWTLLHAKVRFSKIQKYTISKKEKEKNS